MKKTKSGKKQSSKPTTKMSLTSGHSKLKNARGVQIKQIDTQITAESAEDITTATKIAEELQTDRDTRMSLADDESEIENLSNASLTMTRLNLEQANPQPATSISLTAYGDQSQPTTAPQNFYQIGQIINIQQSKPGNTDPRKQSEASSVPTLQEIKADSEFTLIKALKRKYQAKPVAFIKRFYYEQTTSIAESFINLAIIKQEELKQTEQKELNKPEEFRDNRLRSFEDIHQPRQVISLTKIFDKEKDEGAPPQQFLIEGRAGIGKTALCCFIANRWAAKDEKKLGAWLHQFAAVILLPLRQLRGFSKIQTIAEFIHQVCLLKTDQEQITVEQIKQELHVLEEKQQVLYLLDGYDEVADLIKETLPDSKEPTPRANLLQILLEKDYRLLTSRPYCGAANAGKRKLDRHLESVGFVDKDIPKYVEQFFKDFNESEKAESLLTLIEQNANVKGIAYIPINLELICTVWKEEKKEKNQPSDLEDKIVTMTLLYQKIFRLLTRRYLKKRCKIDITDIPPTKYETHPRCSHLLAFLEALAWKLMEKNQLTFKPGDEDISNLFEKYFPNSQDQKAVNDDIYKHFGLLKGTSNETKARADQRYYFVHLTFQEYFAARYVVNHLEQEIEFIRSHKYHPRYQIVWRFVAGLLSKDIKLQSKFLNTIINPPDLLGTYTMQLLMNCLSQCVVNKNYLVDHPALKLLISYLKRLLTINRSFEFIKDYPELLSFPSIRSLFIDSLDYDGTRGSYWFDLKSIDIRDQEMIDALVKKFNDSDYLIAHRAISTIGALNVITDSIVIELLRNIALNKDSIIQDDLIAALEQALIKNKNARNHFFQWIKTSKLRLEKIYFCLKKFNDYANNKYYFDNEILAEIIQEIFNKFLSGDCREFLYRTLKNSDCGEKLYVIKLLDLMNDKSEAARDMVEHLLVDNDIRLKPEAIFFLIKNGWLIGDHIAILMAYLKSGDEVLSLAAINGLILLKVDDKDFKEILFSCLGSKDISIKRWALTLVEKLPALNKIDLEKLASILSIKNKELVFHADDLPIIGSLVRLKLIDLSYTMRCLLILLDGFNLSCKVWMAEAIIQLYFTIAPAEAEYVIRILRRLTSDEMKLTGEPVQLQAFTESYLKLIGNFLEENYDFVSSLCESVNSREVNLRVDAAWALGCVNILDINIVSALKQSMQSADWKVRSTCVFSLCKLRMKSNLTVIELIKSLSEGTERQISNAAELLATMLDDDATLISNKKQKVAKLLMEMISVENIVKAENIVINVLKLIPQLGVVEKSVIDLLLEVLLKPNLNFKIKLITARILSELGRTNVSEYESIKNRLIKMNNAGDEIISWSAALILANMSIIDEDIIGKVIAIYVNGIDVYASAVTTLAKIDLSPYLVQIDKILTMYEYDEYKNNFDIHRGLGLLSWIFVSTPIISLMNHYLKDGPVYYLHLVLPNFSNSTAMYFSNDCLCFYLENKLQKILISRDQKARLINDLSEIWKDHLPTDFQSFIADAVGETAIGSVKQDENIDEGIKLLNKHSSKQQSKDFHDISTYPNITRQLGDVKDQNDTEAFPELNEALQESQQEYETKIKKEQEEIQRNYEESEKKKVNDESEEEEDEAIFYSASSEESVYSDAEDENEEENDLLEESHHSHSHK